VAYLLGVVTWDVWVPGSVGAGLIVGASLSTSVFLGRELVTVSLHCSRLLDLFFNEVIPGNDLGILRLEFGLDVCNFLGTFVIKLDGLQFSGKLQAHGEGVLLGLQDLVTEAVTKASKEQLMLEEICGVVHSFKFGLGDGGGGIFDSGLAGLLSVSLL
jgi:hypothetical protein